MAKHQKCAHFVVELFDRKLQTLEGTHTNAKESFVCRKPTDSWHLKGSHTAIWKV